MKPARRSSSGGPLTLTIINWTGDRSNWGCQATSFGLEEDIHEAAGDREVHIQRVPLGSLTPADRRSKTLFKRFLTNYLVADKPDAISRRLFESIVRHQYGSEVVQQVENSDLVLFMAEGTMLGTSFQRGIKLLELPRLAVDHEIPVVSLNQTIFIEEPSFVPLVRGLYQRFSGIAVREPASLEYARQLGLDRSFLYPDSAFRAMPSGRPLSEILDSLPVRPFLCVTRSASYESSIVEDYLRTVLEFAREQDLQVCPLLWERDQREHFEKLCKDSSGHPLLWIDPHCPYQDVSEVLSQSVGYVGGRYHTAIQAAAVSTPFVAMPAQTHKSVGLLQMLKYPIPIVPFDDLSMLRSALDQLLSDHERLTMLLRESLQQIQKERSKGIRWLGSVLEAVAKGEQIPAEPS